MPLSKFPEDLRVYEHLLWESSADVVIEIGAEHGGSALWFRDRLRALSSYRRISRPPLVVSIDIDAATARAHMAAADPTLEAIVSIEADVLDRRSPRKSPR